MIPREHIEKILSRAVQAPSGDNAQPWRFEVRKNGDEIVLYNIPGKDYSPYNFRERGSFFANGALIENTTIAATAFGYATDIKLFPDSANPEIVAFLSFTKGNTSSSSALLDSIELRATNRKPYKKIPLNPGHKKDLFSIAHDANFGKLLLIEDREKIDAFAKIVSLSDQLIFEEKSIHDAIFSSIRWTKEEEEKKRGMYIKTLELPPPAQALFKMLKSWIALTALNKIGISRFIASQSAQTFAASSAIGMIIMPDGDNESYVKAGRLFERLWLTATASGLYFQPITALAYLAERVRNGDAGELAPEHAEQIVRAQEKIMELFGNPSGKTAMMFRMGYAENPTAHSRKANPDIIYTS